MILIFGGAYQGKLDYAKENFNITDEDVYLCGGDFAEPDFDKKVIAHLERFFLACTKEGVEAKDYLNDHLDLLSDKILISDDTSQGLVPYDPIERAYREMSGRALTYLGKNANTVIRVFVGLGEIIKGDKKSI